LEPEALSLLRASGISVPQYVVVHSKKQAVDAAKSLGWPVVMKAVSPDILHKSDVGGVVLNVQKDREVSEAFARLSSLEGPSRRIEGILVCPFQAQEVEVSVGMVRDSQFGPVITFGLGGIWIEILQDMAYGIAPLSYEEAEDMLQSIRARSILAGTRGRKPADTRALCELLVLLSNMVLEETAIQEIDLNPVFPLETGYFIADARIII